LGVQAPWAVGGPCANHQLHKSSGCTAANNKPWGNCVQVLRDHLMQLFAASSKICCISPRTEPKHEL
jgi:hypothetical protein